MSGAAAAICVDVDDTLYRVRRLRVAWRLRSERGLLVALVAAREKLRHEPPCADREALLIREAELVAPSFGLTQAEAIDRIRKLRAAMPQALTRKIGPLAGVKSALEAASVRGLKLAVLSDYDPDEKLRYLGLDDLPWAVTIGAETHGALKPHRRSFDAVAQALGLAPERIVHVGDREDLDVEGALAAGFRAWRFLVRGSTRTRAEHTFDRWGISVFAPLFD